MPWSFTAQQLQRAFCFYLFSLGVSIPVIFPHLNWKKPQYVLFVLVLWSCFSSWQWNSAQKVSVWFNTIQSGCEWQNSAKICSLWNCSVLTHEQSCCFTKTSHIILKTLSPWSLFQWGGSPLWGHERVFQINFSYHTGMDENLVTLCIAPNICYFTPWHSPEGISLSKGSIVSSALSMTQDWHWSPPALPSL